MKSFRKKIRQKVLFYSALWSNRVVMALVALQLEWLKLSGSFLARMSKVSDYFYDKFKREI